MASRPSKTPTPRPSRKPTVGAKFVIVTRKPVAPTPPTLASLPTLPKPTLPYLPLKEGSPSYNNLINTFKELDRKEEGDESVNNDDDDVSKIFAKSSRDNDDKGSSDEDEPEEKREEHAPDLESAYTGMDEWINFKDIRNGSILYERYGRNFQTAAFIFQSLLFMIILQ